MQRSAQLSPEPLGAGSKYPNTEELHDFLSDLSVLTWIMGRGLATVASRLAAVGNTTAPPRWKEVLMETESSHSTQLDYTGAEAVLGWHEWSELTLPLNARTQWGKVHFCSRVVALRIAIPKT